MIVSKNDIKIPTKYKFNRTITKNIDEDNFFVIVSSGSIYNNQDSSDYQISFRTDYGSFKFFIYRKEFERDYNPILEKYNYNFNFMLQLKNLYYIVVTPVLKSGKTKYKGVCIFNCKYNELDDYLKEKLINNYEILKNEVDSYNAKLDDYFNECSDISYMSEEEKDEMIQIGRKKSKFEMIAFFTFLSSLIAFIIILAENIFSIFIFLVFLLIWIIDIMLIVKIFKLRRRYNGFKYDVIRKERKKK